MAMMTAQKSIEMQWRRHRALMSERASWLPDWMDLERHLMPRSGRYYVQDRNRGGRRMNAIFDSTGTHALTTLGAGLLAGATSPARPWIRLGVSDRDLMKSQPVKVWLQAIRDIMLAIFAKSNTYLTLQSMYRDLGCYGTSASILMDDFNTVITHYHSPNGEYCLGSDYRGNVNACTREFQKTVGELVGEFGYANCSQTVRGLYDNSSYDQWVTICHVIEPRSIRDLTKRDARNKRYASCYFEVGRDKDQYLSESGTDRFKVLAPRWDKQSGDVYGISPGMMALGDVRQLQHGQLRKGQAIDYETQPPLQVPNALKNRAVDQLPGGITYFDASGPGQKIENLFNVNLRLDHLLQDIQDVRARINQAFYTDLFLMISQQPANGNMTATEVAARNEEKLLMLGPVLERMHTEMLSPLVEMTFERMVQANMLPPPPPEMEGADLEVEFISVLAQAQRAITTNGIDRFVVSLGQVAALGKTEVLDKFDSDKWADVYSDALGVDPELIVGGDQVAIVRQQRAQQQAQAAAAEHAQQMADTAQKAAGAMGAMGMQPQDLMNQLTGYGSPTGAGV